MSKLVDAKVVEVCPSPYGHVVFLSTEKKVFAIHMDCARGESVKNALESINEERPLTHEFFVQLLDGLECKVMGVEINHVCDGTFFTKLSVEMENELGRKIVDIDGRPSDTLPLALRTNAPICVRSEVLEQVPDMTDALIKIRNAF